MNSHSVFTMHRVLHMYKGLIQLAVTGADASCIYLGSLSFSLPFLCTLVYTHCSPHTAISGLRVRADHNSYELVGGLRWQNLKHVSHTALLYVLYRPLGSAADRQYRFGQPVLTVAEEMDRVMEIMTVHERSSQFVACHKKWRKNGWGIA